MIYLFLVIENLFSCENVIIRSIFLPKTGLFFACGYETQILVRYR